MSEQIIFSMSKSTSKITRCFLQIFLAGVRGLRFKETNLTIIPKNTYINVYRALLSTIEHYRLSLLLIYFPLLSETITLEKPSWEKRLKSSKFKKCLSFSNSKFLSLFPYINLESGQILLSKACNFANNIDLKVGGFFHWKVEFLFCLNGFVQDCSLLIFLEKTTPNCWMVLKWLLVHCML